MAEEQKPMEEKPEEKCNKELPEKKEEVEKMEEIEDTEETDEEKKKKKTKIKAKKGEGSSQSPEEDAAESNMAPNTTTPNLGVPSMPQDVFVPQSNINVSREQVTPMGKSAEVDLTKSPLYLGVMKQLDGIQETMTKKLEAMEKSMNDRLANTKKELEKFYSQSFYKAASENVAPESTQALSIKKQLEMGKVRFSN